jgi:hypothetical protein
MPAHIEFGTFMGSGAPVFGGLNAAETILTTSSTTTTSRARGGDYVTITAIGAAVMATIGTAPLTAVAGGANMRRIDVGVPRTFGPLKEGDAVAAINAT